MSEAAANEFEPDHYLERLGLAAPVPVTEDGLAGLVRAQQLAIPFENFDILLGRRLDLTTGGLIRKLVRRPRGGYCFELNGLLLAALRNFGFDARPLLARVHLSGEPSARTHQVTLVTLAGREWLADTGFGAQTPRVPIPFEIGGRVEEHGRALRLVDRPPFGTMLQRTKDDGWLDLYSVDGGVVIPADIAAGNHYTESHPDSSFTWRRCAALATPAGCVTLRNFRLTQVTDGVERVTEVAPGPAYLETLEAHFGIRLDATYDGLEPVPDDEVGRLERS